LGGWGKVAYDYWSGQPRVKGRVFNVIRSWIEHPSRPNELLAAFFPYLYLTNASKSSVHILDYELEVFIRDWRRVHRMLGFDKTMAQARNPSPEVSLIIEVSKNLIDKKNRPVEFGAPLHGWLAFAGPANEFRGDVSMFRVTCVDVFGNRHTIETRPDEFANLSLLQEIADIQFPKAMLSGPFQSGNMPAPPLPPKLPNEP
jgi:hypothetical protein